MIFNHGGERNRERKPDFYGFIFFFFFEFTVFIILQVESCFEFIISIKILIEDLHIHEFNWFIKHVSN